jgi:DNA-formamidopyrimidine glycosylase
VIFPDLEKMPESAEVKLTTDYLDKVLTNQVVSNWVFTGGQYSDEDPEGYAEFEDDLPLLVSYVGCKGKMIYICLCDESSQFFVIHSMRTSGSWRDEPGPYARWYIELDTGKRVWYHDTRCLGTLQFISDETEFNNILGSLGPDILSDNFSLDTWKKLTKTYENKNVCSFLMDQQIISGCGNYIKAEALYYAKISPLRTMKTLTENESERLYQGLRIIPRQAYIHKGLSIRDYTDNKGRKGFFEESLKVYGKKTASKLKTPDGRTTYYFPQEQI